MHRLLPALLCASAVACVEAPEDGVDETDLTTYVADHGAIDYSQSTTGMTSSGDVMTGSTRLYLIFYGSWAQSDKDLYVDFATNMSGSPAADVLTTYYDGNGDHATANFTVKTATDPNRSQGTTLQGGLKAITELAITSGQLPRDPAGVYLIFPDASTSMLDGDGNDICAHELGYHTHYTDANDDVLKVGWIVNRQQCHGGPLTNVTPNGVPVVDLSASTVWHEYVEAVSNPNHAGWTAKVTDGDGVVHTEENGDLCEFGHRIDGFHEQVGASILDLDYKTANGADANLHLGARDWLIQNIWLNAERGGCVHRLAVARPVARLGSGLGAVTGDLDGNGTGDLIWRDSSTGMVSAWLLDANDVPIAKANLGGASEQLQIEAIADFNNDGHPDLLWRDLVGGGLVVWDLSGTTIVGSQAIALSLPSSVVVKAVGDFNGDGRADLLFEDYAGDNYRYWINQPNTGIPQFAWLPSFSIVHPSNNVETVGTGDFDGNGRADVLWRDMVNGYFYYWTFTSTGFELRFFDATGAIGLQRVLGIADVDRDGAADIIGLSADGANIAWSKLNGPSIVTTNVLAVPAPEWRFSGATVLVATNRAGILWRNRRTGDVARWALDLAGHFTSSSHIVVGASQRSELVTY